MRGSYYYLDPDHLGNQQLYDALAVADPDAQAAEAVEAATKAAAADYRRDRQRD